MKEEDKKNPPMKTTVFKDVVSVSPLGRGTYEGTIEIGSQTSPEEAMIIARRVYPHVTGKEIMIVDYPFYERP